MGTREEQQKMLDSIKTPLMFLLIIWIIHLIQFTFNIELGYLGVHPRELNGIIGIFTSPLIHGDFIHLFSNTLPFFLLVFAINYFYPRVSSRSFMMVYFLTGLFVWLFARKVYHIGASGVVYGLVSFLFWSGIFRRSLKSVILALIVVVLYSGYIGGILPNQEGISWESHLIGGLVGIFTAYYFKNELEEDELEQIAYKERSLDKSKSKKPFFPSDIFDLTKAEKEALRLKKLEEDSLRKDQDPWFYDIS